MISLTIDRLDYIAAHGYQMHAEACRRMLDEIFALDTVELAEGNAIEQSKFFKIRDRAYICEVTRREGDGIFAEFDAIITFLEKWNSIGEAHAEAVKIRDSLKRIFQLEGDGMAGVAERIAIERAGYDSMVPSRG